MQVTSRMGWQRSKITQVLGWSLTIWLAFGAELLRADDSLVAASSHAPARSWRTDLDWERPPPLPAAESKRTPDYTGWLITGYLSVPLFAVGVPVFASEMSHDESLSEVSLLLGVTAAIFTPGIVHFAYGESGRGARAWGGTAAAAVGGMLIGFLAGAAVGTTQSSKDPNEYDLAPALYGTWGAVVGMGVAVTSWAIFDVVDSAPSSAMRSEVSALRFAVLPHPAGASAAVGASF